MTTRLILFFILVAGCVEAAICPGANGFSNCQSLTVDHTKVPANLTNYPALVCFDATMGPHCLNNSKQLATTSNGGFLQDTTNGFDFIFTSDSAGTVALNYEAKNHNITTGASEIWVQIPSVSSTVDTTIYMFYGKASVTTDQSNASATWDSNFLIVYHFDFLTGSNTTVNDTKGTLSLEPSDLFNDITSGAMGSGVSGIAGGAVSLLNGLQGGFSDGGKNFSGFPTGANPRTTECWTETSGRQLDFHGALAWGDAGAGAGWTLSKFASGGVDYWGASSSVGGSSVGRTATSTLGDGMFHHIAITFPSGGTVFNDAKVYVDGTAAANDISVNGTTSVNSTSVALHIGCGVSCNMDWYAQNLVNTTLLDECRISDVERSADWIKTEYNNVSNPSTFFQGSTGGGGVAGRTIIIN